MAEEMEKINAIFRLHEEKEKTASQKKIEDSALHTAASTTGKTGSARMQQASEEPVDPNDYDEEDLTERDFQPVRRSREYHSGCLGGLMYFTFIVCVSVVLACLAWMATSDMLALNKDDFTAVVTLPSSIFQSETVDKIDENGVKTGTKRVTHADMDYVADVLKDAGLIEYEGEPGGIRVALHLRLPCPDTKYARGLLLYGHSHRDDPGGVQDASDFYAPRGKRCLQLQ